MRLMNDPADAATALMGMQDDIYREKTLRARKLTPEQRLADVFELSNPVSLDGSDFQGLMIR